jgi:hypothetical protein
MSVNDAPSPSASPAPTVPAGDGPGSCARCESEAGQFAQWRIRMMELAAESALAMLRKITDDTVTERTEPQADGGLAYSRISKALRQALLLHAKFEEDSYKTSQERAAEAAARQAREAQRAAAIQAGAKAHQKRQVEQAVKQAMDAELAADEKFDYGGCYGELLERLDDYDDYSDFGRRPVSEIVEGICKVLDLTFDPALWEDEPWVIEEAKAKPAAGQGAEWPETANDDEDEDEDTDPFDIAVGTGPP